MFTQVTPHTMEHTHTQEIEIHSNKKDTLLMLHHLDSEVTFALKDCQQTETESHIS